MGPSTFSIGFDYLYNETLSSYQSSFEHIHYLIQKIQAYARIQQWKKIIP
jgi:hypothetical protein